jgi:hypothetical protein
MDTVLNWGEEPMVELQRLVMAERDARVGYAEARIEAMRAKLAEDYAKSQWTPSLDEQVDVNAQKTAAERDERRRMYRDAALQELKLAEIAAVEAELRAETAHIYAMHCLDVAFLHAQQEGNR